MKWLSSLVVGVLVASSLGGGVYAQSSPAEDGTVVLTRGPLHEAVAEQFDLRVQPGFLVRTEPPEPVAEIPPGYRPPGEDVVWVPGYWAWDDEDFLWVSGCWRVAPPGHRWVPGYWTEASRGYRWVSGFWTELDRHEIQYLPFPPELPQDADFRPTSGHPSAEHFWVPGQWRLVDGQYEWQPGFWARGYVDWVWVPARYVWTPAGCIYRAGYWDYGLAARGTLFAPVRFREVVYTDVEYRYTPLYVIDLQPLVIHLFVRPDYHHYYFGDYYGQRYVERRIFPWIHVQQEYGHYDPLYSYYWSRPTDNYLARVAQWYGYYEKNERVRPPHTLAAQRKLAEQLGGRHDALRYSLLSNALLDVVGRTDGREAFRQLSRPERTAALRAIQPLRQLQQRRAEQEAEGASASEQADAPRATALALPRLDEDRVRVLRPAIDEPQRQPGESTPERSSPSDSRTDRQPKHRGEPSSRVPAAAGSNTSSDSDASPGKATEERSEDRSPPPAEPRRGQRRLPPPPAQPDSTAPDKRGASPRAVPGTEARGKLPPLPAAERPDPPRKSKSGPQPERNANSRFSPKRQAAAVPGRSPRPNPPARKQPGADRPAPGIERPTGAEKQTDKNDDD